MLRRLASAAVILMILILLTGCGIHYSAGKVSSAAVSAVNDDAHRAQAALVGFIGAVDNKDFDSFVSFTDICTMYGFSEADSEAKERMRNDLGGESWTSYFSTYLVTEVPKGRYDSKALEALELLKTSPVYQDVDISSIDSVYRFDLKDSGTVYVVHMDGKWLTDLGMVNAAVILKEEKERE